MNISTLDLIIVSVYLIGITAIGSQPGERGFDAGKKICGRKRHLLVDTLGRRNGVRLCNL